MIEISCRDGEVVDEYPSGHGTHLAVLGDLVFMGGGLLSVMRTGDRKLSRHSAAKTPHMVVRGGDIYFTLELNDDEAHSAVVWWDGSGTERGRMTVRAETASLFPISGREPGTPLLSPRAGRGQILVDVAAKKVLWQADTNLIAFYGTWTPHGISVTLMDEMASYRRVACFDEKTGATVPAPDCHNLINGQWWFDDHLILGGAYGTEAFRWVE